MNLLTRDEFRKQVFNRDNNYCVICHNPAVDAHHIMEKRLFSDGGYYLDNGASLCEKHHLEAEETTLSTTEIREAARIKTIILPEHFYPDNEYDKWGNIINGSQRYKGELFYDISVQKILAKKLHLFLPYIKYPRTYHLPFSLGRIDDDRVLKDCSQFEGKEVVVTVKMDGENTTGYSNGYIHARSLDGRNHISRNWVKSYLAGKLYELPKDWRICGENLYAKHSIHYTNLDNYFYLFSIWTAYNECLSWDETLEWATLLDLVTVPVLYRGIWDEKLIRSLYKETYRNNECEGFVVRNTNKFTYRNFAQNIAKYVRESHVKTNKHWLKTSVIQNGMIGYKV